ncbi:hypothetical protein GOBAR_AA06147 [Gossypium barbadense]|uniref:Uncharacterized protein n=1 Tax=Gossypium barbadense TaxID=3634 RepID=A0A2P5YFQ1_GOSBA|nr:hypothetical protein GOBAR_AA06147 [Gossypium barbadense]
MAEQTALNSICDTSSNFHLFAKSSFKNLTAFGICERASINGYLVVIQKSVWQASLFKFRAFGLMLVDSEVFFRYSKIESLTPR